MRNRTLSCFQSFRCLAGACPDTCCAGWEIDLDEAILEKYAVLPGVLGEEIRSAIRQEDGYTFFACREGRCPFLNAQNLCRLILDSIRRQQPEETLLSEVCREHPRFYDCYGELTEISLSISCPEAARLLLQSREPAVIYETAEAAGQAEPDPELDEQLLKLLEAAREQLLEIAGAEKPFQTRLSELMAAAAYFQGLADNRCSGDQTAEPAVLPEKPESWHSDLADWLCVMEQMEFTDDRLPKLMRVCRRQGGAAEEPVYPAFAEVLQPALKNLLVYFLYRYVLRAVWDKDVLSKVGFAVRSVEAIAYLAQTPEGISEDTLCEAAVRYSREAEHSDENLGLLYDEVWKEYLGQ